MAQEGYFGRSVDMWAFGAVNPLLTTYYSPLTTHHPPLTTHSTHHPLLTTHRYPAVQVLFEMLHGMFAFTGGSVEQIFTRIRNAHHTPFAPDLHPEAKALITVSGLSSE